MSSPNSRSARNNAHQTSQQSAQHRPTSATLGKANPQSGPKPSKPLQLSNRIADGPTQFPPSPNRPCATSIHLHSRQMDAKRRTYELQQKIDEYREQNALLAANRQSQLRQETTDHSLLSTKQEQGTLTLSSKHSPADPSKTISELPQCVANRAPTSVVHTAAIAVEAGACNGSYLRQSARRANGTDQQSEAADRRALPPPTEPAHRATRAAVPGCLCWLRARTRWRRKMAR